MNIRKIFSSICLVVSFFLVYAEEIDIEAMMQSSALPTGGVLLAAAYNGDVKTASELREASFWQGVFGTDKVNTSGTVGKPWLIEGTNALPTQRDGQQENYIPSASVEVSIGTATEFKALYGKYKPYKIKLTDNITFASGDTLYPLHGIKEFDGGGYTLNDVVLAKHPNFTQVGLFTSIEDSVYNLTVKIDSFIPTVYSQVGVLMGHLPSGAKIRNCHVVSGESGNITVKGVDKVGGLVGESDGTISGCTVSKIDVVATANTGTSCAGGLAGLTTGLISDSKVSYGSVTANFDAGGLVGKGANLTNDTVYEVIVTANSGQAGGLTSFTGGTVKDCKVSSSEIRCTNQAGGFVGWLGGTISGGYADSLTVSTSGNNAGGLVGWGTPSANINGCIVDSVNASATGNSAGGIAGVFESNIENCKVSRVVVSCKTSSGGYGAGGLVGRSLAGEIRDCKLTTGKIDGYSFVGGMAGSIAGDMVNDTVFDVKVTSSVQAGGLVASTSTGGISECRVSGSTIKGADSVGGLFGISRGAIQNCSVDTSVVEATGSYAGGLVGYTTANIDLSSVDSLTVTSSSSRAGGIAGYFSSGTISGCKVYRLKATATSTYGGGIAGYFAYGEIKTSSVDSAVITANTDGGGITGRSYGGTVNTCRVSNSEVKTIEKWAGGIYGSCKRGKINSSSVYNVRVSGSAKIGGLSGDALNDEAIPSEFLNDTVSRTTVTASNANSENSAGGLTAELLESSVTGCRVDSTTVRGGGYVAGLVGINRTSTISGCSVDSVRVYAEATGGRYAGGLVGDNFNGLSNILSSSAYRIIVEAKDSYAGGVSGSNYGTIDACSVDSATITVAGSFAGGIDGITYSGNIKNSSVYRATISGENMIGGLSGKVMGTPPPVLLNDTVSRSTVTAGIDAPDKSAGGLTSTLDGGTAEGCRVDSTTIIGGGYVGGLLGNNYKSTITSCSVDSVRVYAKAGSYAGGLVGINSDATSKIESNSAYRIIVSASTEHAGGIVGRNIGSLSECTVDSAKISTGTSFAGGIAGYTNKSIEKCSVSNAIITAGLECAGGIVGKAEEVGTFLNLCSVNNANITAINQYAGGIVGYTKRPVSSSSARYVEVTVSKHAGGIAGLSSYQDGYAFQYDTLVHGTITAKGDISGYDYGCSGGIAGYTCSGFSDCFVDSSDIKGNSYVGGLAGNAYLGDLNTLISDSKVDSVRITSTTDYAGGIVGSTQIPISQCTVSRAIIKAESYIAGGITGVNDAKNYNLNTNSIYRCTVTASEIEAKYAAAGGIVGENVPNGTNGTGNISEAKVVNCTITLSDALTEVGYRYYGCGGIAGVHFKGTIQKSLVSGSKVVVLKTGSDYNIGVGGIVGNTLGYSSSTSATVSECAVLGGTYIEGHKYVGGISGAHYNPYGSNLVEINNCHVDNATIYSNLKTSLAYIGGIVGYSTKKIERCLVTNAQILDSCTDADLHYIGGIAGAVAHGSETVKSSISNCVALIDHYDLKAKYTKNGTFGRIIGKVLATNTLYYSLSDNYGWGETYIKYGHKYFGVNWQTDNYYKAPGNIANDKKNGYTCYSGNVDNGYGRILNNSTSLWSEKGYTANGWTASNVSSKLFPVLSFFSGETYSSLSSRTICEAEWMYVKTVSGVGFSSMNISSPVVFTSSGLYNPSMYFGKLHSFNLYTDLLFAEDDGSGNSVFWAVDLNSNTTGTASQSPFIREEAPAAVTTIPEFNGNGYSIDGLYINNANTADYLGGLFRLQKACLKISKLEVSNFKSTYNNTSSSTMAFMGTMFSSRFNWQDDSVYLENVFIKNPTLEVTGLAMTGYNTTNIDAQHKVGGVAGQANYVNIDTLALFVSSSNSIQGEYSSVGGLFGRSYQNNLNNIALYFGGTYNSTYNTCLYSYSGSGYPHVGYVSGYGSDYTLNNLALRDKANFLVPVTNYGVNSLPTGLFQPGVGGNYPNQTSFADALTDAGITNGATWHIPASFADTDIDSVYLVRDVSHWQ